MIGNKTTIVKGIDLLSSSSTAAETAAIVSVNTALNNAGFTEYASLAVAPDATTNKGRIIFVNGTYYFSDGTEWSTGFSSVSGPAFTRAYDINGSGVINEVQGGIQNWSVISSGSSAFGGVTDDNIAYMWGTGSRGQLGTNNTSNTSSPVTVVGGITNWSRLEIGMGSGGNIAAGITDDNNVYLWGSLNFGAAGDNTSGRDVSSPITVISPSGSWTNIVAGDYAFLGVTSTNNLYVWGIANNGALAQNNTAQVSSPSTIVGSLGAVWETGIDKATCKNDGFAAITTSGVIYSWGAGFGGNNGDGSATNRSSPVSVIGGITTWDQIAGGQTNTLGLTTAGVLYGWGDNSNGVLGVGDAVSKLSPVTVVGGITNWSKVTRSGYHCFGITTDNTVYGWGQNGSGQLGISGDTTNKSSPVTVPPPSGLTWLGISRNNTPQSGGEGMLLAGSLKGF